MKKVKQAICIAALAGSLASPAAWADHSTSELGLWESLLAQLQLLGLWDAAPLADDLNVDPGTSGQVSPVTPPSGHGPGDQAELGPNVAVGG